MIRAVVFDLDGTLVDSLPDIHASLNYALATVGIAPRSSDWVRRHVGHGAAYLIDSALAGEPDPTRQDRVLNEFVTFYEAHPCPSTRPYSGVMETLRDFHRHGLSQAVISNKPAAIVRRVVAILDMAPFFEYVWGGDSFPEKKPSPMPLRHLMARKGFLPTEVLMVGDSGADIESARLAGVWSCFCTGGYGTLDGACAPPHRLIGNFAELPPIVFGWSDS